MAFTNAMVVNIGNKLANASNVIDCSAILRKYSRKPNITASWRSTLRSLTKYVKDMGNLEVPHSIFAKGNSKLPFYSYSELSMATCPGKGACAQYCYSTSSWRFPEVVGRQIMNMLIMRFRPNIIAQAFNRLPKNVTLRLYVDGDFSNAGTVQAWFAALNSRPDIKAYGYSKSWDELYVNKETWPINYKLNLSNGGVERTVTRSMMESLSGVRGSFLAVRISKELMDKSKRYSLEYHMAVRQQIKEITGHAGFSCPGLCGDCNIKGSHACGSDTMRGIAIGIGIH